MSLQLVGKENLPNVHIKEIELHRSGNRVVVKTNTHLYDYESNGQLQWYNNESLRKNIKIMVVASRSTTFNQEIINGRGFLTPKDITRTEGYSIQNVQKKTFSIAAINKKSFENEEDGLYTFPYRCSFEFHNVTNLSVFAVCYLDTEQYSLENSIDLSNQRSRTYHGAIVGENVLLNNEVPRETNLLHGESGYHVGPVHFHNGKYMDGSKHSSVPHESLATRRIKNTKVKEFYLPFVKRTKGNLSKRSGNPIGELWCSFGSDGVLNASFPIDMDIFLQNNSDHAHMLRSLDEDLYSSLLDSIYFDKVTIRRQQVNSVKRTNNIGTSEEVASPAGPYEVLIETKQSSLSNILEPQSKYCNLYRRRSPTARSPMRRDKYEGLPLYSSISEIRDFASGKTKRLISFQDATKARHRIGKYQYTVDVSFKDPARKYLEDLYVRTKQSVSEFKNYRSRVLRPTNYNYHTSTTKRNLTGATYDSTWTDILQNFMQLYNLMFQLDEDDKQKLYDRLVLFLHPKTLTSSSIEWFYNKYMFLTSYYESEFKVGKGVYNTNNLKRGYVQSDKSDLYSKITKTFKKIVDYSEYGSSVSFMTEEISEKAKSNNVSYPVLTYSDIRKMANLERAKFFSSDPTFNETTMQVLNSGQISSLNNIRYNSYSYFSPASVSDSYTGKVDLSKLENIDLIRFNNHMDKAGSKRKHRVGSDKQSRRKMEFLTNERKSFYIKANSREQENNLEYKDSVNVLGTESKFSNEYSRESKVQQNKLSKDIHNRFSTFNVLKEQDTYVDKSYFVIDNEQSVMSQILNSTKSEAKKKKLLRNIPLQVKALIGSQHAFTKNNILHSKQDLFVNPATKNLIQTSFLTLVKVQYLVGYSSGNQPIWRDLHEYSMNSIISKNNWTVLCRFVPVDDSTLGINADLFEQMGIQSEYFYLSKDPGGIQASPKQAMSLTSEKDFGSEYASAYSNIADVPLNYTKTAIITQPNSKNGPLGSVDYGVASQDRVSIPIVTRPQARELAPEPSIGTVTQPVVNPRSRGGY